MPYYPDIPKQFGPARNSAAGNSVYGQLSDMLAISDSFMARLPD
jgi:hypothetical protein